MAREFGQLDAAAWRDDDDWRALPADAQWLYMLLVSQGDLSAAGVLTFAAGRWQRMAADVDPERFTTALAVLEDQRYVFTDLDDLELLVRSYARRKTQWNNPRRRAAVENAAKAIHSPRLRMALAVDLSRAQITLDCLPSVTTQAMAKFSPEGSPERLAEPFTEVIAERSPNDSATGSRARAHQKPEARSQKPEAPAVPADAATAQAVVATWVDAMKAAGLPYEGLVGRVGRNAKVLLGKGTDPRALHCAAYNAGALGYDDLAKQLVIDARQRSPTQGDRFAGHLALIEQLGQEGA